MDIEKELEDLHSSQLDEDTDKDLELYASIKKKKKSKKKSKLDLEVRKALDAEDGSSEDDLAFVEEFIRSSKKRRKDNIGDEDIFGGGGENGEGKKLKNIEAKFKPELANLTKLLKENEATSKLINDIILPIVKAKGNRVSFKGLTDLISTLNISNSNRLSTIREIGNIKKAIIDLKLKAKKDEGPTDLPMDQFGSRVFEELFREGRNNVIDKANDLQSVSNYAPNDDRSFEEICEERLATENNSYRSDDGNKMIEYETRNPEICIRKSFTNGSLDVVAIDSAGVIIDDYPVPSIENLGKLVFNNDAGTATDVTGRVFKVIDIA